MGLRGKGWVNVRPPRSERKPLSMEERKAMAIRGAQYSPTMERWVGFLFDGRFTTTLEPRTNRARALKDAHDHYDRIFHPQSAGERWAA
jgi:hypothetical protein